MIAHPLELVAHVVERQQEAQVTGDRLLGGDDRRDLRRQLELGLVDPAIVLDDPQRSLGVVVDERIEGGQDLVLDEDPHPQDGVLDRPLAAIELRSDGVARTRRRSS